MPAERRGREKKKTTVGKFGGIIFRLGGLARLRRDQGKPPLDPSRLHACSFFFYSFLARKRCAPERLAHTLTRPLWTSARGELCSFCRQFDRRSEERKVRGLVVKALLNPRTRVFRGTDHRFDRFALRYEASEKTRVFHFSFYAVLHSCTHGGWE